MGVCSIHKLPAGLRKDQPTVFFHRKDLLCICFVLRFIARYSVCIRAPEYCRKSRQRKTGSALETAKCRGKSQ